MQDPLKLLGSFEGRCVTRHLRQQYAPAFRKSIPQTPSTHNARSASFNSSRYPLASLSSVISCLKQVSLERLPSHVKSHYYRRTRRKRAGSNLGEGRIVTGDRGGCGGRALPRGGAHPVLPRLGRLAGAAVRSGRLRERPCLRSLKKPNDCHRPILAVEKINGAEVQQKRVMLLEEGQPILPLDHITEHVEGAP